VVAVSGGILLIVAGIWVVAQVTAGHALQRLGILAEAGQENADPSTGVPNQNPSLPPMVDPQGRPY
jgi:hypothetical protein